MKGRTSDDIHESLRPSYNRDKLRPQIVSAETHRYIHIDQLVVEISRHNAVLNLTLQLHSFVVARQEVKHKRNS